MKVKLERYASGKWDLFTVGDYSVRIGHIAGGNGRYCAESGPITVGYFKTLKAASDALRSRREAYGAMGG